MQIPKIEGNGEKRKIAKRNWKTHAELTRSNQADNRNKFEYIYSKVTTRVVKVWGGGRGSSLSICCGNFINA